MTVFTCNEDTISILTCIYDAWASRLGHENVRLLVGPVYQPEFFADYIHVEPNEKKAESVITSINRKISPQAASWVLSVSDSFEPARADWIYRFLILGFKKGPGVCEMLQEPAVVKMMEVNKAVGREGYLFREFMRFSSVDGKVYVAHFEPKSNVIVPVADHFADRMGGEYWIIVDDTRNIAAVHPKNEHYYLHQLEKDEIEKLKTAEKTEDGYTDIWREYVDSIAIKERINPRCQMSHFPLWMRKHAVEFN